LAAGIVLTRVLMVEAVFLAVPSRITLVKTQALKFAVLDLIKNEATIQLPFTTVLEQPVFLFC
jgi:hypothetical protein